MKRSVIVISALISLMLFQNCSKNELNYTVQEVNGVKVYHNKNIPSDPNFKITPKKLFTIEGYDENATDTLRNFLLIKDITVDSRGNVYLLDSKLASVKIFDRNGKYLKSIGRKGTGPGEFNDPFPILMLNDTLYICDNTSQISVYDNEYNFIRRFSPGSNIGFMSMMSVSSDTFISTTTSWKSEDEVLYFVSTTYLRDAKFNITEKLKETICKFIGENTNFFDYSIPYCVGDKDIYFGENSTNEYSIEVLDTNGNIKYKIKKDFRKIMMPNDEEKKFEDNMNEGEINNINHDYVINYKRAIELYGMFVAKDGHLLIQVPLERNKENEFDLVVDAFKDGVFINRFKMDIGKAFDFYNVDHKRWFIGNRIYYVNREDNSVTVYEY
jgi:hypothetical protein